jgi:4-hydroxybenzoate polyprenyltransferase
VKDFFYKISVLTRTKDWRLSFVPFIMGCTYLWLGWFNIDFNNKSCALIILSLCTTVGFASLGYLINEYFDIETDKRAGKLNKLAYLSSPLIMLLFSTSLCVTFFPWIVLPTDNISWFLIALQLLFFLLYSLPFPRLKEVPIISNFLDAGYAYWIPLMLSHHTYALFAKTTSAFWLPLFSIAVFLIGFRNILIHQVDDIFNDKRAGIKTLPMVLGVAKTDFVLKITIVHEVLFLTTALLIVGLYKPEYLIVAFIYLLFSIYKIYVYRNNFNSHFFSIENTRHFTDSNNQYVLPISWLIVLGFHNVAWLLILPVHLVLLFPFNYIVTAVNKIVPVWYFFLKFITVDVRHLISMVVNYPIYYAFKIVGIDLIRENKTAADVLLRRRKK